MPSHIFTRLAAARAAELADNDQVAAARYSELLEVVKKDAARPELALVKSFVAKK